MCFTSWDANLDNHAHPAFLLIYLPLLAISGLSGFIILTAFGEWYDDSGIDVLVS